jgi:hypothetical protein
MKAKTIRPYGSFVIPKIDRRTGAILDDWRFEPAKQSFFVVLLSVSQT